MHSSGVANRAEGRAHQLRLNRMRMVSGLPAIQSIDTRDTERIIRPGPRATAAGQGRPIIPTSSSRHYRHADGVGSMEAGLEG